MYRDLRIWQKSMDLVIDLYNLAEQFPKTEEYNLKSQLKRVAVSVPLNIAEGKSRISVKDFAHFLNIASASLTEVEVVIEISMRLGYIKECNDIQNEISELNRMINAFRTQLLKKSEV